MRFANLIRLALLALMLSFVGASATSASPLSFAAGHSAGTPHIQTVGYYGHYHGRSYDNCYRPYRRNYSSYYYRRDYYRPNRYYRNDYSDYQSSYYSTYRRPYRYYNDYDNDSDY